MVNRHARQACTLGPALPIFPLPVSVIEPSFRTLLVAAIGATPLTEPSLVAAGQAAITVSAITVGTEKKHRAAFAAQTNSQPENHFVLKRHAYSQAALDNGSSFVAG
jgi:hypothetical protein